jgi:transposase
MHFIPTCSSRLNQVERFFGLITDKAIRRMPFTSVSNPALVSAPSEKSFSKRQLCIVLSVNSVLAAARQNGAAAA